MLLSIIVPVYNTSKYVRECIESLLSQNLHDFEIICIDDGSTDNSLTILRTLEKKHHEIRVLEQDNQGQSIARNKGIKEAKGKYIYFMDSDDILTSNSLNYVINLMENKELELYSFDGKDFTEEDYLEINDLDYQREESYGEFKKGEELLNALVLNNDFTPQPCLFVVKSTIIKKNNLCYIENIIHEDEAFTVEVFFYAGRSMHENHVFFNRRIRPNSIMTTKKTSKNFIGYYEVFKKLYQLYSTTNNKAIRIRLGIVLEYIYFSFNELTKKEKEKFEPLLLEINDKSREYRFFSRGLWLKYYNQKTNLLFKLLEKVKIIK